MLQLRSRQACACSDVIARCFNMCNFISAQQIKGFPELNEVKPPRPSTGRLRKPATIDIVSRLERVDASLSPAERRVADVVTADYEMATRMTIAELASRAEVSQPTVTRFCRTLGCTSFSEFKISLATTLTVAAVYLRSERVFDNDAGQLAHTVMMRAAGAVRECLDQIDTTAVGNAIDALAASQRIVSTRSSPPPAFPSVFS